MNTLFLGAVGMLILFSSAFLLTYVGYRVNKRNDKRGWFGK
jgi:hypothetical protein